MVGGTSDRRQGAVGGYLRDEPSVRRPAEIIYGTLVLMSVLTALSEETTDPGKVMVTVAGTAVTLFLTRWYSEVLAETVTFGKGPSPRERRAIISDASLLLAVAVVPVVFLLLAIVRALSLEWAVDVSLLFGTGSLGAWGYVKARRAGAGPWRTAGTTATTLGIGLVLVTLKAVVH
jgi:ABC-type Fe3+ transport system permease subunit